MSVAPDQTLFLDPNRCIGCEACVAACSECDTHKGVPMIHLEQVDRQASPQTAPVVCMHCEDPTCAQVCPAEAIKKTPDGVVQSARKERCVACDNCGLAWPFGVPKVVDTTALMSKCDLCYDRTSVGLKPMCASVCPSQALFFGTAEEIAELRPASEAVNSFEFGQQQVDTRVQMLVPKNGAVAGPSPINVTGALASVDEFDPMLDALYDEPVSQEVVHA